MRKSNILLIALSLVATFIIATVPIKASGESSSNATWVASDNFTMQVTIADLQTILTSASAAQSANLTTLFDTAVGYLLVAGVALIAYWRRIPMIYVISGLLILAMGFAYFETSNLVSIAFVIVGIMTVVMAFLDKGERTA